YQRTLRPLPPSCTAATGATSPRFAGSATPPTVDVLSLSTWRMLFRGVVKSVARLPIVRVPVFVATGCSEYSVLLFVTIVFRLLRRSALLLLAAGIAAAAVP